MRLIDADKLKASGEFKEVAIVREQINIPIE